MPGPITVWKMWPARNLETGVQPEPVYVLNTETSNGTRHSLVSLSEAEAEDLVAKVQAAISDE